MAQNVNSDTTIHSLSMLFTSMRVPRHHNAQPRTVQLIGEVVEILEKDGRTHAQVALKSGYVEVCTDALGETHLGDQILVEAGVSIRGIQPVGAAGETATTITS
jgi:hypothetical protein